MTSITDLDLTESGMRLVPVWHIYIELGPDDGDLYEVLSQDLAMRYGNYSGVAFTSGPGHQFFRPEQGSIMREDHRQVHRRDVHYLTFSLEREPTQLREMLRIIRDRHSYEEPVIYVSEAFASRLNGELDEGSPAKWWNRDTAHSSHDS